MLNNGIHTAQVTTRQEPIVVRLTPREQEIAALVAKGLSNKEIARQLDAALGTVKIHLHHIYEKLAIKNRTVLAILNIGQQL